MEGIPHILHAMYFPQNNSEKRKGTDEINQQKMKKNITRNEK
jgi:hypothetical protein